MTNTTKKICYTALMLAATFITTFIIKIPIPNGYIHPGDAAVYLSAYLLGPIWGTLAAGLGAATADYFAGFGAYILPTLIAKGLMAALCALGFKGRFSRLKAFGFMSLGGLVMAFVYYLAEGLLYGSFVSPLINIPFNLLQAFTGIAIAQLLFTPLKPFRLYDESLYF